MTAPDARAVSRRWFLGGAGVLGAGLAAGAVAGCSAGAQSPPAAPSTVPFHGGHQAGIGTPAQDRLAFASFDLSTTSRADLRQLLQEWTAAAAAMCAGRQVPGGSSTLAAPPADTGEAVGLSPARLTVTIGFGPSLFDHRFGLAARRPAALAAIPALPRDDLQAQLCGGDIGIQACADDPVVAFHVIRNLRGSAGRTQRSAGRSSALAGPRPPARLSRHRVTCSASRTAPATSTARTPRRWTGTSGSAVRATRPGCAAAPTW